MKHWRLARDLQGDLERDLNRVHDLNVDLALNLSRANRARDRRECVFERAPALDDALGYTVAIALERAREDVRAIDRVLERAGDREMAMRQEAVMGAGSGMLGRVPRGVVALATRMLPARERPRYREEFRGELVELPRHERLGYALRVLACAWALRRALTDAVRTLDGSPSCRTER